MSSFVHIHHHCTGRAKHRGGLAPRDMKSSLEFFLPNVLSLYARAVEIRMRLTYIDIGQARSQVEFWYATINPRTARRSAR